MKSFQRVKLARLLSVGYLSILTLPILAQQRPDPNKLVKNYIDWEVHTPTAKNATGKKVRSSHVSTAGARRKPIGLSKNGKGYQGSYRPAIYNFPTPGIDPGKNVAQNKILADHLGEFTLDVQKRPSGVEILNPNGDTNVISTNSAPSVLALHYAEEGQLGMAVDVITHNLNPTDPDERQAQLALAGDFVQFTQAHPRSGALVLDSDSEGQAVVVDGIPADSTLPCKVILPEGIHRIQVDNTETFVVDIKSGSKTSVKTQYNGGVWTIQSGGNRWFYHEEKGLLAGEIFDLQLDLTPGKYYFYLKQPSRRGIRWTICDDSGKLLTALDRYGLEAPTSFRSEGCVIVQIKRPTKLKIEVWLESGVGAFTISVGQGLRSLNTSQSEMRL